MSDHIDTREGWLEVSAHAFATARGPRLREDPSPDDNGLSRYWVRDVPDQPLPTELWTVIRPTDRDGRLSEPEVLTSEGWERIGSDEGGLPAELLSARIASFEVLSEPRAVTAKDVLDMVGGWIETTEAYDEVAREFGVDHA